MKETKGRKTKNNNNMHKKIATFNFILNKEKRNKFICNVK